jgi:hypothetical protein
VAEHDPWAPPEEERAVARLYRELPREEPPARLDDAIRAEARRLGVTHPAPLVTPTGRRSWHYPVAAAAVIVLAVAVTWHVEREQPDSASLHDNVASLPAASPAPAQPQSAAEPAQAGAKREVTAPKKEAKVKRDDAAKPAEAPAAAAADSVQAAPSQSAMRAPAQNRLAKVQEPPEPWLERIAQLRKDGKNDEADQQLAEFRKRYPDYRIAPELLEKVEKK